jgi:hypothetical protein
MEGYDRIAGALATKDNLLLFPVPVVEAGSRGAICCRERLGGLLKVLQLCRINYLTKRALPRLVPNSDSRLILLIRHAHAIGSNSDYTVIGSVTEQRPRANKVLMDGTLCAWGHSLDGTASASLPSVAGPCGAVSEF